MSFYQIYFSPTGGTKKVAGMLSSGWQSVKTIDLSNPKGHVEPNRIKKEDTVLVAMPSFGGLAPEVALERLGRIRGNGAACILVCVYGNRAYEDTLVQMEDTAERAGFSVIAAVSAVAEHSIMHQYATGRPNDSDQEKLTGFSKQITEKIQKGDRSKPSIPGNRPYKKSGGPGLVPKAGKSCTSCGSCARLCPVGAIDPKNPKATNSKKCISCMRCVSICPAKARKVNGPMVSAAALTIKKACSKAKEDELFI